MPYRARIKVCGITRVEDAATAINEGIDALGLVFHEPSPRYVEPAQGATIAAVVPAFVDVVALFVDAPAEWVRKVVQQVQPDLLQFHGREEPAYCASFGRPYIKALRVQDESKLLQFATQYQGARALLLDSFKAGAPGGTGQVFDWSLIPPSLCNSIILAGGLNAGNVAGAISRLQPYAVDVSGGVERQKGIKDAAKIRWFVQQVQAAGELI